MYEAQRARGACSHVLRKSGACTDSKRSWAANLFGHSSDKQLESHLTRAPLEMSTRHDKEQLPPTLACKTKHPKEAEWNKFLNKLHRSRQKQGVEMSGGEMIGAWRFGQEGADGRRKMEYLVRLIIEGIPMEHRQSIWMELSNTRSIMVPDEYSEHLQQGTGIKNEDDIDAISKDVVRTLTSRNVYYIEKGRQKLKNILVAFVGKHRHLGYTQGLNDIAGHLLFAIPSEEEAFWVLCNIVEDYFPKHYFDQGDGLKSPVADTITVRHFIKQIFPQLSTHMDDLEIEPTQTVPMNWFFTGFANCLPANALMRLWDVWICVPGQKHFLFAFALALVQYHADAILRLKDRLDYLSFINGRELLSPLEERDECGGETLTTLIREAYKIGKKIGATAVEECRVVQTRRLHAEDQVQRRRRTSSLDVLGARGDGEVNEAMETLADAAGTGQANAALAS